MVMYASSGLKRDRRYLRSSNLLSGTSSIFTPGWIKENNQLGRLNRHMIVSGYVIIKFFEFGHET
jgi:hypothetical protein